MNSSEDIGIPLGQDLMLDAANVLLLNTDNNQTLVNNLVWTWLCPLEFDCSSVNTNLKQFVITSEMLPSVLNMDFMKRYLFVLRIRTQQNLPVEMPYLQKIIHVTWLGPPKNVTI